MFWVFGDEERIIGSVYKACNLNVDGYFLT